MDDDVREFGLALGRAVLAKSWTTAHGMLAAWLRGAQSADDFRKFFENACMNLQCSDEQMQALNFDTFCEVWIAVVETPEGLRVGYWSQGAY